MTVVALCMRRLYKRRYDAGMCVRCGYEPRRRGRNTCQPCKEAMTAYVRRLRLERCRAGLCPNCGKPRAAPFAQCAACLERRRKWRKAA